MKIDVESNKRKKAETIELLAQPSMQPLCACDTIDEVNEILSMLKNTTTIPSDEIAIFQLMESRAKLDKVISRLQRNNRINRNIC